MAVSILSRLNYWTLRGLLGLAAALAFLLGLLVVTDVVGRAVFASPLQGTPEIVSTTIVIICFLLAGYAVASGGMLRVELILQLLGPRLAALLTAFGALLGAGFFALIVWGGIDPFTYAWQSGEFEGEGALRVPVWPARAAVLLGSLLVALNYLGQFAANLSIALGLRPPPEDGGLSGPAVH